MFQFEQHFAGVGAFILDTSNNQRFVLDGEVPAALIKVWSDLVGVQVITQIELWPVVASLFMLSKLFEHRRVIFFIDNDAARESLIRAFSPSIASLSLIMIFYKQATELSIIPWFARVPSSSNPADLPSRGQALEACERFQAKYFGKLKLPKLVFRRLTLTKENASLLSSQRQ